MRYPKGKGQNLLRYYSVVGENLPSIWLYNPNIAMLLILGQLTTTALPKRLSLIFLWAEFLLNRKLSYLIALSIYKLLWENSLAVIEVIILVFTSALPRGTLSTCHSDTPILGIGHVRLYPLDTVPTHPHRALGFSARGSTHGELSYCIYHGRTT